MSHEIKRKKRILFVITQSEIGGAQQFLSQLLSHIDRQRFHCSLVVGAQGTDELKKILPPDVPYRTAGHLRRNPRLVDDLKAVGELASIIKEEAPDILFLNSSKAGFIGSLASRKVRKALPGLSVIYRIGGWTFNDPWPRWKKWAFILLERLSSRWKDYIVVNNSKDLEDAERLGIRPRPSISGPSNQVLMIHNGIDPYMEFLDRDQARSKIFQRIQKPGLDNKMMVGTIANFYPPKGLEYLVRAAALADDKTIFVIIGDGALRPQLTRQLEALGLKDRVFLVGKFQHAWRYLPAFDLFILPSVKEGFPWSVLEAMAAKVPVIATRVGALPELVEHGRNGLLVQPARPDQLARAVELLLGDENLRRELVIQAHQTILKDFTLRQMVEKYEKLFS